MSGFSKMNRVTWKFYLTALLLLLLLTGADSFYVCVEDNSQYEGRLFAYGMENESAGTFLEKNSNLLENGKCLFEIYNDKVINFQIFGYYPMILVLLLIMLCRQYVYMDRSSAEFQRTVPVKQWVQVFHEYFSIMGILALSALLQLGIFIAYQTSYNREMLHAAKAFSLAAGPAELVSKANGELFCYWGVYFMYIAAAFTWMYFGTFLAKHPVAGVAGSLVVYDFLQYGMRFCHYSGLFDGVDFMGPVRRIMYPIMDIFNPDYKDYFIGYGYDTVLEGLVSPQNTFSFLGGFYPDAEEALPVIVCVMLAMILGMILIMGLLSGKRDLSKGKFLYFPWMDYVFSVVFGFLVFFILNEYPLLNDEYDNEYVQILIMVITGVVFFLLIHPWSEGKRKVLEVK